MTLNAERPKVPYISWITTHDSKISLHVALQLLVFQIIKVFDFSIGYNGELEIFEKKFAKNQELKISTRGSWALTLCLRTNLAIGQSSTYTLFYPRGSKWGLFLFYGPRLWSFSKMTYFGMKLGHWTKFQKLHVHSLSTPGGRNWAYFQCTGRVKEIEHFLTLILLIS